MRATLAFLLSSTVAMAEVPRVVTDIPPVHSIVAMVMGDLGSPELLLAKGGDEHDFQLRPSQMASVAGADLVIWIGPDLTPWLQNALDADGGDRAVLTLFDDVGTYKITYFVSALGGEALGDEAEHAEEADHAEDSESAEAEGHGHDHDHDHAEGAIDPHVWLDPSTAAWWTGLIATELARLDPANAATYATNAEAARVAIVAAEDEVRTLLAPVADRPFVTYHDAYGYFITAFGLTPAGTIALGDAAAPGAARLQSLRDALAAGGVVCIFPEVQHDPALVSQLVEGTSTRIGGALDPVGSMLTPGPEAYVTLLRSTAATLADCLAD